MKKTRILALTLAVAIMLVGAGYAAWSETLTINTTVETGNLNIDLANGSVAVFQDANYPTVDGLNRTATAVVDSTKKNGTVTITNLYPGAKAVVTIPYVNTSTIPVKVDTMNLTNVPSWLSVTPQYPSTLSPSQTSGNMTLTINVLDTAAENATATFNFNVIYEQFNQQ